MEVKLHWFHLSFSKRTSRTITAMYHVVSKPWRNWDDKNFNGSGRHRWVEYADRGRYNASQVPPEWHGWLHHITDHTGDEVSFLPDSWYYLDGTSFLHTGKFLLLTSYINYVPISWHIIKFTICCAIYMENDKLPSSWFQDIRRVLKFQLVTYICFVMAAFDAQAQEVRRGTQGELLWWRWGVHIPFKGT